MNDRAPFPCEEVHWLGMEIEKLQILFTNVVDVSVVFRE